MIKNIYKKLVQNSLKFLSLNDYDLILENILTETRKFLNADAGTIYIKEGNYLLFQYTQNDTLKTGRTEITKLKFSNKRLDINDNSIAGYVAHNTKTLNIEDAYKLNGNLPFSFNKNFDKLSGYRTKSILTVPITNSKNEILGVIQVINKKDKDKIISFTEEDEKIIIKYFALHAGVALERAKLTREIILRMVKMAELRDPSETGSHVQRVSNYSAIIYRKWAENKNINEKDIVKNLDLIKPASILHDVGKVGIPDAILKKPGKLTDEEYNYMKMHTVYGARLFETSKEIIDIVSQEIALNHHERWDGKGYPGYVNILLCKPEQLCKKPKKGNDIPIFARIVSVADVFDALISKRVYKPAWKFEDAVGEIKKNAGSQFDPDVVTAFEQTLEEIKTIAEYYK